MRASAKFILLLLITVIFIVINVVFIYFSFSITRNDAEIINKTGMIRGSIQRAVKMELAANEDDPVIEEIDELIQNFLDDNYGFISAEVENTTFQSELENINSHWNVLKDMLHEYRENPSPELKLEIINISEKLWEITDDTVFSVQVNAESKRKYFTVFFIVVSVNIIILVLTIWFVKKIIRDKLEMMANYDFLTKINNRASFIKAFDNILGQNKHSKKPLSLILFDIDHFKQVNDLFGHAAGDDVLKELSDLITDSMRKDDIFARIGGEEFAIILYNTEIKPAMEIAERLRKAVEDYKFSVNRKITISLGLTEIFPNDQNNRYVLKRADDALYCAKENGRNRIEVSFSKKV